MRPNVWLRPQPCMTSGGAYPPLSKPHGLHCPVYPWLMTAELKGPETSLHPTPMKEKQVDGQEFWALGPTFLGF